jgi:hypothetical protein
MFGPEFGTFGEFAEYFRKYISCDPAIDFAYNHEFGEDPHQVPCEWAYVALRDLLPVLGPTMRWIGIARLGDEPFWAARGWMTISGLTDEEYHFLFARGYPKQAFAERVESGVLTPGSRAKVILAAPGGQSLDGNNATLLEQG